MIDVSTDTKTRVSNPLLAIAAGGLIAGILDLGQAIFLFGAKIPLAIAAGLLGHKPLVEAHRHTFWVYSCTSSSHSQRRLFISQQVVNCDS